MKDIYYAEVKDGVIVGYYNSEIHGKVFCEELLKKDALKLNKELWNELVKIGSVSVDKSKLEDVQEGFVLDMEYLSCFSFNEKSVYTQPNVEGKTKKIDLKDQVAILTKEINSLTKKVDWLSSNI